MTPAKTPWIVLVTAFCLALAFGGVALVNAAGSPAAALTVQSPVPTPTPAGGGVWRSGGPYAGDVQALALSPAFATDGLALAGGGPDRALHARRLRHRAHDRQRRNLEAAAG